MKDLQVDAPHRVALVRVARFEYGRLVERPQTTAACWRAAWNGQDMVGVALRVRRHDHTVGEVEELSVRTLQRRLPIGRALLLIRPARPSQTWPGCTATPHSAGSPAPDVTGPPPS